MLRTFVLGIAAGVVTLSAAAQAQPANKDIVETAVAAGSFKTLAKALQAADLVDTLKGKGPFTVFAPTDTRVVKTGVQASNGVIHVIDSVILPDDSK